MFCLLASHNSNMTIQSIKQKRLNQQVIYEPQGNTWSQCRIRYLSADLFFLNKNRTTTHSAVFQ